MENQHVVIQRTLRSAEQRRNRTYATWSPAACSCAHAQSLIAPPQQASFKHALNAVTVLFGGLIAGAEAHAR